jgi:glyoxylate/hydroxypyruvate reductase
MIIPFVGQVPDEERDQWVQTIGELLPQVTLVPFAALSETDRQKASVAIVANPNPAEILKLPNLKWIHSVWAGVERLVAELKDTDLPIVRLIDPELTRVMTEAVLAWTFYLHRDMPHYKQQQQTGQWNPLPYVRADRRKIGVLGLGVLGASAAVQLKENGFDVIGWSRSAKDIPTVPCESGDEGLVRVIARSDFLVCLLPLTEQTKGLMSVEKLSLLPTGASVINFARGPIFDYDALVDLLDKGHLNHAVLDVFDQEPLPADHQLWKHSAVTVLPHIAAQTDVQTASEIVARNISQYLVDGSLPKLVDRKTGY